MHESTRWGPPRYLCLLAVLSLHVMFIALLLMRAPAGNPVAAAVQSVEVLVLPPVSPPKVRVANLPPRRLSVDAATTAEPPVLVSPSISTWSASSASSNGSGSGVDWLAEKRRAVQAFEIRQHQPATARSVSGRPGEDIWWPRAVHHAGDQFKTPNGDWIVWINANCYQVATSGPSPFVPGAIMPETICHEPPGAVR